jgi:hypothetical protein
MVCEISIVRIENDIGILLSGRASGIQLTKSNVEKK